MSFATFDTILNVPITYFSGAGPGAAGNEDLRVAGTSGTPGRFRWTNTFNRVAAITRLSGAMVCSGAAGETQFGNITALTNGVLVRGLDSGGSVVATFANLKTNADIYDQTGDPRVLSAVGTTRIPVLWKSDVNPLIIRPGEALEIVVQDDLTTLTRLRARLGGALLGAGFRGSVSP